MDCVTTACFEVSDAAARTALVNRETLVLLHGSAGSSAMWSQIASSLQPLYRILAPNLIGYGGSDDWPTDAAFDLQIERAAIEPLLRCCAKSYHLIGYSYGGVVALDLALAQPERVRTLTLIEPVFFNVLHYAGQWQSLFRLMRIRQEFQRALDHDGPEAALPPFIDFWAGRGAWQKLPPQVQAEMLRCAGKIALDWQAAFAFAPERESVAALGPRTLLLRGDRSPSAMLRLVDSLHSLMPGSTLHIVAGANHLLPLARAEDLTEALLSHLQVDAERRLR